jgi:hypothetical protein
MRRENIQCGGGYEVCFGMKGDVLCKSHDVEIVQNARSGFIIEGKVNAGSRVKDGYIYSSSCDFLVPLLRYENVDS